MWIRAESDTGERHVHDWCHANRPTMEWNWGQSSLSQHDCLGFSERVKMRTDPQLPSQHRAVRLQALLMSGLEGLCNQQGSKFRIGNWLKSM